MAHTNLFSPERETDNGGSPCSMPDTEPPYTPPHRVVGTEAFHRSQQTSTADAAVEVYDGELEGAVDWEELDLSSIPPQDYPPRLLMMPVVKGVSISPHGGNGNINNWVKVDVKDPSKGSKPLELLAIAPTREQVGCCVDSDEISCVLLFDPSNDRLILRNNGSGTFYLTKLYGGGRKPVKGRGSIEVPLGEWNISGVFEGIVVEFKVLGHAPCHVTQSFPTKRSVEDPTVLSKKTRLSADQSAARVVALPETSSNNPLLTLERGEVIRVGTGKDSYTLKRMAPISDQDQSSVWHAQHSENPGKAVVVKLVKSDSRYRNATVRAIGTWMSEVSIRSSIGGHHCIVPYIGSDARFLSIYTEYVNAQDLTFHTKADNTFDGNDVRAWTILGDMASAISFLHANNIVHGDIKLGNILYDPVRGAVLKGFHSSFRDGDPVPNGSAPWYLPPEFMSNPDQLGASSDMWALGIVMMWVLHVLPMPEKQVSWNAVDIHPRGHFEEVNEEALSNMQEWLSIVRAARSQLEGQGDELAEVVCALVKESDVDRINAETLVERIEKCNRR
ncbi:kinase-like domain-containing protein [Xylaria venustula]|nr:kinase-like domain-containing protein [Xylaria venustula]